MIELTCVACGTTQSVYNRTEEKRDKMCPRCGESLIELRRPGNSLRVVEAHA